MVTDSRSAFVKEFGVFGKFLLHLREEPSTLAISRSRKAAAEKLTAEKNCLYEDFFRLKDEVIDVEIIQQNMERIMQVVRKRRGQGRVSACLTTAALSAKLADETANAKKPNDLRYKK